MRSIRSFFRHEIKSFRFYDNIVFRKYFYEMLNDEDKKFSDLLYYYKRSKKDKRALRKYVKAHVKNKSIRFATLFLLFFGVL